MKKNITNILSLVTVLGLLVGCGDNLISLDKQPKDLISGDIVFKDKSLVEANLAQIYEATLFRYGDYAPGQAPPSWIMDEGMGALARGFAYWQQPSAFPLEVIDENGAGPIDYWTYSNIREANTFIEGIQQSGFEQSYIDQKVAEARYLRAHEYWQMVKRYGGVPLLTEAQSADSPVEELNVPRAPEQEIYDFIASEMDAIKDMLREDDEPGRVDKYTALALKSRAMLYAGSIGEFGTVQTIGSGESETQLGISNPQQYWQAAYDASKDIIDSGNFSLYNKIPGDPAENFEQLFVDASNNPERIFVEVADPSLNRGHSFSRLAIPFEFRKEWCCNFCPFLQTIEMFEYADGSPGTIPRADINGNTLFDIDQVFRNRDPRFLATFFFPQSKFQGGEARFHIRTVMSNGDTLTSGSTGDWPNQAPRRNWVNTGFLLRKYVDESEIGPVANSSDEDFLVFRYGEILLNYAEAAFYLGRTSEALDAVNQIRSRAGMPALNSISEDAIRHERSVELLFEDHRYWDLRRWRIAEQELDGFRGEGLRYTYHFDQDRYDFHLVNGERGERTFQERHYYLPLGVNRIADNPNLVENPGY